MNKIYYLILTICVLTFNVQGQTNGVFGGDAVASGFPHQANTNDMWLKFGEITLNGAYSRGTLHVDFFPDESPHGDSRQTVIVELRNSSSVVNTSDNDIVLITQYGKNRTLKDVRVVHTSGSGISNNKFSIWMQMEATWIANVPIEVRSLGTITYHLTHQPYYSSIQDTGTTYGLTSSYGLNGSVFEVSSENAGDAVLRVESDADNFDENDNARIEIMQDGGGLGAYIGFNKDWGGTGGSTGAETDNLFRIGTRYSGTDNYNRLVINTNNGNVGMGTTNPGQKLHVSASQATIQMRLERTVSNTGITDFGTDGLGLHFWVGGYDSYNNSDMFISPTGYVGIGTNNPANKLDVAGTIRAEEVKVEAQPWPDYVFSDTYELSDLSEVSDFINENGHLPNIPSASEVEENGIMLGEMNAKLLEKIEELTLYLIELKDENKNQKELNDLLIKRIEKLENK